MPTSLLLPSIRPAYLPVSAHFQNAKKLLRFLETRKASLSPLLLLMHNYPDPDALAAAYTLHYLAEKAFGIQSRIVYGGIIGRVENRTLVEILHLPVHPLRADDFKRYARVALVDTQPGFKNNALPKGKKAVLVIDQHPSLKKNAADLCIVDPDCGATCVILAQALLLLHIPIPAKVATALVYGIMTDTLNLFRARRPDVLQTYLYILPYANLHSLARIQNPSRNKDVFITLGLGMAHSQVCGPLLVSHLGPVATPDLTAQVADFLLSYKQVQWTLCTGRYQGTLHVSLRTKRSHLSAATLLRAVFQNAQNAGGHDTIAGGSLPVGKNASPAQWRAAESGLTERLLVRLKIPRPHSFFYPFRNSIQSRVTLLEE